MSQTTRNIIITGAGSGIGAATARAFSASGDRVHLFDVSQARLDSIASELQSVKTYLVDVTDAARVRETIEGIEKEYGSVDVLVSNAGIFDGLAGIEETSYELWHRIIETNLTGAFNVIKPASEAMVRQKAGRIITISSIAATRSSPDGLSYDTSKAGLEGMTRRLAVDLGKYGITANSVAPGVIETDILSNSKELLGELTLKGASDDNGEANAQYLETVVPARRTGQPAEVASTIHFLASEGAAYINGEVIHVDGGWIAS
ncbi:SDR family NAD(P)-dependent oxidoreductase [Klebsiella pasteurii]|uniref:SDR family NAD(P)-dependent oxidoreductase n=1 Tax=Klebsiella pasteurii TaxID=2587529 RepID=A0ABT5CPV8_9ENTR|nr:SDR family NAD(P)-dependent oxidoreductase [Klebsiella pasteurii]MBG2718516.1 SDR family oxidoreductase [Klebsiella michiganensis]MDC0693083.1 SDR family NAD(P)-dependent oxidoreductase [Klebsiella pasteurii]MDC0754976.1 SDR family NAD(P)-dependent oxidoreductase [Klebsiella pasteurii]MDQ2167709.1 SDR family NAD(P)-dependent oxidoreductase [Klebsiella pasteurii]MDQ2201382.1 SDR family NAD(P)-dependent oxidoreductase [Klebsiella pasteurii]